jgi:hypothetical protein
VWHPFNAFSDWWGFLFTNEKSVFTNLSLNP